MGGDGSGGEQSSGGLGGGMATGGMGGGSGGDAPVGEFSFLVTGASITTQHGGTDGTEHNDVCPAGQVLVGFTGTHGNPGVLLVTSLVGLCAQPTVSGPDPFAIALESGDFLPARGNPTTGSDPTAFSVVCPADEVVIGFFGRAGSALDQLGIQCGALSTDGESVQVTPTITLGPEGGTGGTPFTEGCPEGEVAYGSNLREPLSGSWITALGFTCGTPEVAQL
jgi:hypothetical protein